MGFHHVAIATSDVATNHAFYTEAMGFELVKVEMAPSPEGGWAKHLFYDTGGGGLIAFWDLHLDGRTEPTPTALSRDLGLPEWVNHIAFDAPDAGALDAARKRWLDLGIDVIEVDHGFCRSIYALDPGGTLVEWCVDVRPLDEADRRQAVERLVLTEPDELDPAPEPIFHRGDRSLRPAWLR